MDANVIASITSETNMSAELKGTTYLATPSSTTATISSQTSKVNGVSTTTITITDAYGTKTDKIIVSDGAQGPQGIQGEKGDTGATGATGAVGKDADVSQFYTKTEIDAKIGDISTALTAIVGGA